MNPGAVYLIASIVVLALVATWGVAILLCPLIKVLKRRSAADFSSGFWFLLAVLPLFAGATMGLISFGASLLKTVGWIVDHCSAHPGHPHLCWTHLEQSFTPGVVFWGILAGGLSLFGYNVYRIVWPVWAFNRNLKAVGDPNGFAIVRSKTPCAFVAGIFRPRVYLTDSAENLLTPRERAIVLTHEREHIRRWDTFRSLLIDISARLFPGFGAVREKWTTASEVECDRASLRVGASPEEVSMTILKFARAFGSLERTGALAYSGGSEAKLRLRIESLLRDQSSGRSWILPSAALFTLIGYLLVEFSGTHHALETILGVLRG